MRRIAALLLFVALATVSPGFGSDDPPGTCFAFKQVSPGEVKILVIPCPASSAEPIRSELDELEEALYSIKEAETLGWTAGWMARNESDHSLQNKLGALVTYTRSVGPEIPEEERGPDGRDIPAKEIKEFLLHDWAGEGRPPEARMWKGVIEETPAEALKAIHDGLRKVCYTPPVDRWCVDLGRRHE